jgi:hypothetical protein
MHLCIVGDGAAGWWTYHHLKDNKSINKITVIGSPTIPKVGVGESTTMDFSRFITDKLKLDGEKKNKFLVDIDAAIKCGVDYQGWTYNHRFLHHFLNKEQYRSETRIKHILNDPSVIVRAVESGYILGKKPKTAEHNEYAVPLYKYIYDNKICIKQDIQQHTFHFDANKFIKTMMALAESDEKLIHIRDTVVDLVYDGEVAKYAVVESGDRIHADYFVSCVGQTGFNQKIFREEYESLNDILLTNKALFYPLPYKDRKKQFHPYTVAKTMKYGWRWITPTLSRIGTGYAFSDRHISVEKAIEEFQNDIGDSSIQPFMVDFYPRRVKETFKKNTCTIGLASGFQEPLDAPGLTTSNYNIHLLEDILNNLNSAGYNKSYLDKINFLSRSQFDFWTTFILHQYKTCDREDTDFWKDHKNVEFSKYDEITREIFDPKLFFDRSSNKYYTYYSSNILDPLMFYNTTSGKNIQWSTKSINATLNPVEKPVLDDNVLIDHREFFDNIINSL